MNTDSPTTKACFEDRLLAAILDDFDDIRLDGSGAPVSPRRGRKRLLAAGALAAAVAVGVAVPLALGAAGSSARSAGDVTTLHLAAFSLRLPASYHHVSSVPVTCYPGVWVGYVLPAGSATPTLPTPPNEPGIVAAVDQAGGCVAIGLTNSYTPGAAGAPFVAARPNATQPVQVDGYQGWVGTREDVAAGNPQVVMDLTIPTPGGQVQDLLVGATGISQAQLVSIVSSGLSLPSAGAGPLTTLPSATASVPIASTSVQG